MDKRVEIVVWALQPDPDDPAKTALVVGGTPGDDTILFGYFGPPGTVRLAINSWIVESFDGIDHLIVYSQTGHDRIGVSSKINLPIWVFDANGQAVAPTVYHTVYPDPMGVYADGYWYRDVNGNGVWDSPPDDLLRFGFQGATPVVADWDGDGKDDVGVYDQGWWYRDVNGNSLWDTPDQNAIASYGWSGALPVVGNWTDPGSPLLAAGGPVADSQVSQVLTQAELRPIIQEAIARWAAAGLSAPALNALKQVQFVVTDLPGSYLGLAQGDRIYLDRDAAGHGWFLDPTPRQDEEFAASRDGSELRAIDPRAVDRIDLLTVVEHELGHVATLRDLDPSTFDLMSGQLATGMRRTATKADVNTVLAQLEAQQRLY